MYVEEGTGMNRKRAALRLCCYLALALCGGVLLCLAGSGRGIPCPVSLYLHRPCPSCGATRALSALLRLDFKGAAALNPVLALGVYPIAGLLAADDILSAVYVLCTGRERLSMLRFFFGKGQRS